MKTSAKSTSNHSAAITDTIAAPAHLSARTQSLWAEYAKPEKGNSWTALFQTALESLDRSDQARALIDKEGLTVTTARSGVAHIHPATRIEKDARMQFCTAWRQLGLDRDSMTTLRPFSFRSC
jgi:P27 family predicted phage terminase small subunit